MSAPQSTQWLTDQFVNFTTLKLMSCVSHHLGMILPYSLIVSCLIIPSGANTTTFGWDGVDGF
jgi:hypothetical protein